MMDDVSQTSIPELLRNAFDDKPQGMVLIDNHQAILQANSKFIEFTGLKHEDIKNTVVTDLLSSELKSVFVEFCNSILDDFENLKEFECNLKQYPERWLKFTGVPVQSDQDFSDHIFLTVTDISQLRRDLADSLENQHMINAIFLSSADGIISIDHEGTIESFNPAAESIFGYKATEIIGEKISILIPEEQRNQHNTYIDQSEIYAPKIINRGRDLVGLHKDQSLVPIELNVSPMLIAGQRKFVGMVRNVSKRKEAEESLRKSEARFRDFAIASADRFWETDEQHRFTFVSESPTTEGRIQSNRMIGKTRWELDNDDHNAEFWAQHKADMDARRPFSNIQYVRKFEDGTVAHLRASGVPIFDSNDEFKGYRGTNVDITELKLSQNKAEDISARFISALEFSPLGIAFWDSSEKFITCNDQYRILNETMVDLLEPNLTYIDYISARADKIPFDNSEKKLSWIENRLKGFRSASHEREIHSNGKWLHVTSYKLPDNGTIVFANDISDQKMRDEKLRQSQKVEAIGQLTGGIAHDFNNLLAVVLGNLQLTMDSPDLPENIETRIKRALNAVQRGSALTQRLLAFSRQQDLKPRSFNPGELIESLLDLIGLTLGEAINIDMQFDTYIANVTVDPHQLENSIFNLAINARDAMPKGGDLSINCSGVEIDEVFDGAITGLQSGQYVKISVIDNGVGMSEKTLEQVFEPFFTTKEVGEGSGLGLSMVFGFVTQSGGSINIESQLGKGTTVDIYLPVADTDTPDLTFEKSSNILTTGDQEKILLIEDDLELREIVTAQLEELNYTEIDGGDGKLSLDILQAYDDIELLLTDVVLPHGNNGIDIATKAMQINPTLKVVIMTGYAEKTVLESNASNMSFPILYKPFAMHQLATMINDVNQA